MSISNALQRRSIVAPLLVLLLLSLSSGLVGAQPTDEGETVLAATSADNDYATCAETSSTLVTCSLKIADNQSSLNLVTNILPLAQAINADVQSYTVMWVQAWGGKGGKGKNYDGATGGWGGFGGYAQTITTIDDYQSTYGTTTLHYYFGAHGNDNATTWGSGAGGASTIVASVASGFAASNVLLVAGGGGGGNYAVLFTDGQEGGHGGTAIATSMKAAYGAGQDLSGNNGTVRGGSYSGPGRAVRSSIPTAIPHPVGTASAAGAEVGC